MESTPLLDCAGRRRSPATTSSFHQALPPRNKGMRYPPDPPAVEEIVAVMRADDRSEGERLPCLLTLLAIASFLRSHTSVWKRGTRSLISCGLRLGRAIRPFGLNWLRVY